MAKRPTLKEIHTIDTPMKKITIGYGTHLIMAEEDADKVMSLLARAEMSDHKNNIRPPGDPENQYIKCELLGAKQYRNMKMAHLLGVEYNTLMNQEPNEDLPPPF